MRKQHGSNDSFANENDSRKQMKDTTSMRKNHHSKRLIPTLIRRRTVGCFFGRKEAEKEGRRKEKIVLEDFKDAFLRNKAELKGRRRALTECDLINHTRNIKTNPPLLKQWIDVVLEYNWAYGPHGNFLNGKKVLTALTAGGTREVYCSEGKNHYTINQFLRPFEQTARLCGMRYLPPFAVLGTHRLDHQAIQVYKSQYVQVLQQLSMDQLNTKKITSGQFINDLDGIKKMAQS